MQSQLIKSRLLIIPLSVPEHLTLEVHAERDQYNEIHIVGTTNLPEQTRLGVHVPSLRTKRYEEDIKITVTGEKFSSVGLDDEGVPFKAGPHKVIVLSHFNQFWQTPENLQAFGDNGMKLPLGSIIKPEDPNLIDSDRVIDEHLTLNFPPLNAVKRSSDSTLPKVTTDEDRAIKLVKSARLSDDRGVSSETVEGGVLFYMSHGITSGKGWSATPKSGKTYTVEFDFNDGPLGEEKALWEADLYTKKVRYISKYAKNFSWIPNY